MWRGLLLHPRLLLPLRAGLLRPGLPLAHLAGVFGPVLPARGDDEGLPLVAGAPLSGAHTTSLRSYPPEGAVKPHPTRISFPSVRARVGRTMLPQRLPKTSMDGVAGFVIFWVFVVMLFPRVLFEDVSKCMRPTLVMSPTLSRSSASAGSSGWGRSTWIVICASRARSLVGFFCNEFTFFELITLRRSLGERAPGARSHTLAGRCVRRCARTRACAYSCVLASVRHALSTCGAVMAQGLRQHHRYRKPLLAERIVRASCRNTSLLQLAL